MEHKQARALIGTQARESTNWNITHGTTSWEFNSRFEKCVISTVCDQYITFMVYDWSKYVHIMNLVYSDYGRGGGVN